MRTELHGREHRESLLFGDDFTEGDLSESDLIGGNGAVGSIVEEAELV